MIVRLVAETTEWAERAPFILKEQSIASAQGNGDDHAVVMEAFAPKVGIGDTCCNLVQEGARLTDQGTGGQSAQVDDILVKRFSPRRPA